MHNITKKEKGLGVARRLASNGEHVGWRSVEAKMNQLGHYEADLWFADMLFRNEIEAICVRMSRVESARLP